jgi:hypothetical protein|tara:strand:- start:1190 stop:1573 length:384 start_codon:yes stop_codon:yes gene_type:complete
MPDVLYVKKTDAIAYQEEVGGQIVEVDEDADGVMDGWKVLPEIAEGSTRGPNPSELAPLNGSFLPAAQQEKYLEDLEAAGSPQKKNMGGVVVDELGYMNGGMSFSKRQPVSYSKGGAVKGKKFAGTF